MNLSYRGRKRLSKVVDRHAEAAEEALLEDGHGEAIATIASNAVHDALLQDEQLGELIAISNSAEQITEDRGAPDEDEIGDAVSSAWFSVEGAIESRAEEVREEVVADVVEREAISA